MAPSPERARPTKKCALKARSRGDPSFPALRSRYSTSAERSSSRIPARRNFGISAKTPHIRAAPSRIVASSEADFTWRCSRRIAPASTSSAPGRLFRQKSSVPCGTASNATPTFPVAPSVRARSFDDGNGRTSAIPLSALARAKLLRTRRIGAPAAGT